MRLIVSKLPADNVAAARKRKAAKAKKAKRKLTPTTVALAGWVVLITTLDASWPATEVLRLYQARWQIELVFKRIKQLLRRAPLRCQNREAVEATVRALVLAWALQEQVASEVRARLPSGARAPQAPARSWLLAGLGVQTVRQHVRGRWTLARLQVCLPQLVRFLVSSPRKRQQQEAELRQWLVVRGDLAPLLDVAA